MYPLSMVSICIYYRAESDIFCDLNLDNNEQCAAAVNTAMHEIGIGVGVMVVVLCLVAIVITVIVVLCLWR